MMMVELGVLQALDTHTTLLTRNSHCHALKLGALPTMMVLQQQLLMNADQLQSMMTIHEKNGAKVD